MITEHSGDWLLPVAVISDLQFCELIEEIPCGVFEISFPRFSSVCVRGKTYGASTFYYLAIFLQKTTYRKNGIMYGQLRHSIEYGEVL